MQYLQKIKKAVRTGVRLLKEKEMIPIPQPVNAGQILAGKVALITGGSGGIGLSMARSFLDSGARVIIAGINTEKLKKCCEALKTSGGGY